MAAPRGAWRALKPHALLREHVAWACCSSANGIRPAPGPARRLLESAPSRSAGVPVLATARRPFRSSDTRFGRRSQLAKGGARWSHGEVRFARRAWAPPPRVDNAITTSVGLLRNEGGRPWRGNFVVASEAQMECRGRGDALTYFCEVCGKTRDNPPRRSGGAEAPWWPGTG